MNNKADIPVTVLVIGVFAVCSLAMVSFFYVNVKVINSFVGLNLIEEVSADMEKINFPKQSEIKGPDIQTEKGSGKTMLYREKKTKTGIWPFRKEKLVFSVKYYLS
jgi:hypothetical protein